MHHGMKSKRSICCPNLLGSWIWLLYHKVQHGFGSGCKLNVLAMFRCLDMFFQIRFTCNYSLLISNSWFNKIINIHTAISNRHIWVTYAAFSLMITASSCKTRVLPAQFLGEMTLPFRHFDFEYRDTKKQCRGCWNETSEWKQMKDLVEDATVILYTLTKF